MSFSRYEIDSKWNIVFSNLFGLAIILGLPVYKVFLGEIIPSQALILMLVGIGIAVGCGALLFFTKGRLAGNTIYILGFIGYSLFLVFLIPYLTDPFPYLIGLENLLIVNIIIFIVGLALVGLGLSLYFVPIMSRSLNTKYRILVVAIGFTIWMLWFPSVFTFVLG